jgi:hypothetical protein
MPARQAHRRREAFDKPESFTKQKQPGTDGWRGGIGTWSIKEGAAYAVQEGPSEKRPNGHEAVCEHIVDLGDYVLTGEFKLGASPQIGFVCRDTNKPNLHQGRVMITPTAIWIQKMSGISKETRREELKKIEVKLDPNTWHRITIEICGDHFFAKDRRPCARSQPRALQGAQRPSRHSSKGRRRTVSQPFTLECEAEVIIAWTVVTDEVATCHYEFRWKGLISGQESSGGGRGTTILRRVDDRWLIAHEHLGPYPRK